MEKNTTVMRHTQGQLVRMLI